MSPGVDDFDLNSTRANKLIEGEAAYARVISSDASIESDHAAQAEIHSQCEAHPSRSDESCTLMWGRLQGASIHQMHAMQLGIAPHQALPQTSWRSAGYISNCFSDAMHDDL